MDKMKNMCWVVVLMVVVSGGWMTAEGTEPMPGMVSYWTFDEGEGDIAYDSFGNNDGAVQGAVWTTGQIDSALEFNGVDDYVDLGTDSSLKLGFPITYSAWIKRFSTGSTDAIVILGRGNSSWHYGSWFEVGTNDKLGVGYGDGGGKKADNRRSKIGTTTIGADSWYHVAAIIRGAVDMDLYINGQLDPGTYSGSGGNIVYGGCNGFSSIGGAISPFNGLIDDVAVFNRSLTPEEIQQIYQDGLAGLGILIDYRQIAINKINEAIEEKTEALERVNLAMERERVALGALNELSAGGEPGELSLMDIFKAKVEIVWAMGHQINAKFKLRLSINRLEKALRRLTLEPKPGHEPPPHPERPVRPRWGWSR